MTTHFDHVLPEENGVRDPQGVASVAQLWGQLRDQQTPLTPFISTSDGFVQEEVAIVWNPRDSSSHWISNHIFIDLPDEFCRQVQEQHARSVARQLFGVSGSHDIPLVRPEEYRDDQRKETFWQTVPQARFLSGAEAWLPIRQALVAAAREESDGLGRGTFNLLGFNTRMYQTKQVKARIEEGRLIFTIGEVFQNKIIEGWTHEFRRFLV